MRSRPTGPLPDADDARLVPLHRHSHGRDGCTGTKSFTIVVCGTILVAPATLPNGTTGTGYSQRSRPREARPLHLRRHVRLPPGGLTLSSAGLLSGTPTASGTFNFTVTATDAKRCTGTKDYSLQIVSP